MTFNELLADVVSRWQQLHERLDQIDAQDGKYPAVRTGKRLETVINWRDSVLPVLDRFLKVDLPSMRAKSRQDAAEALTRIRAGRPLKEPARGKPEIDWASVSVPVAPATPEPNREVMTAISSMRDELLHQARIANAITLHQLASTDRLAQVVAGYRTAAEDPDNFPAEAFRLDSVVLPPLLRARIDGGDARATFVLQQLEEVEPTLLRAAGLVGDVPERSGPVRDVETIREAVERLGAGGLERLDELDATIAPYARAVERQRQEAQQVA